MGAETNLIVEGQRTRWAYVATSLLQAPLFSLFSLLPFILCKDLHAGPLALTLLMAIKPITALLATYWGTLFSHKRSGLKGCIIAAVILGAVPTLLFPFFSGVPFLLLAFALHMVAARACIPAWMEILKLNIPVAARSKVFSNGSLVTYLFGLLLPLLASHLMDGNLAIWHTLFPFAGLLALLSLILQFWIPIEPIAEPTPTQPARSLSIVALEPWKNFFSLMARRPDFRWFQGVFLFGGLGLMVMQPALPVFTVDILDASYTEVAIAISLCKSAGFALTNRLWASWMNRVNLFFFCAAVTLLALCFPLLLASASHLFILFFCAYFIYGVMQAGSELGWNLSGPIFAKDEESSPFTRANILMVGLRGLIGPAIGGIFLATLGPSAALAFGAALCLIGALYGLLCSRRFGMRAGVHG